jgi:exo-beta-1,3-glucanase (GH17 family)
MKPVLFLVLIIPMMIACSPETSETTSPMKVEIVESDDGYRLLRGGRPYEIRGAGMSIDDIERFAANGGNSIRNWTTISDRQDTQALLDAAHAHGVTVALGLPMHAERHGFDYNDEAAVAKQLAMMQAEVLKYRDHPAVLAWLIGNELDHSYTNPRVWDAVNDVARMIHELDPNHPVSTTLSGFKEEVISEMLTRAPDLDFYSFQLYGSLFGLPDQIRATGFDKPFMLTEWGTIGYWEMESTSWGAPVELTSSEKADVILRAHNDIITPLEDQMIGSYVFFWGQKQERTPTWFGLLTRAGDLTEAANVMNLVWTNSWPANRAPRVHGLFLDGKSSRQSVTLVAGESYEARFDLSDHEGDPLIYRWVVRPESDATQTGGDFERDIPGLDGLIAEPGEAVTTLTAPEPGRYRLFAYATDDHGHAAHANIPFLVPGEGGFAMESFSQSKDALLNGQVMAVAYSGFREGQHPDRGDGASNPSEAEILEDLKILVEHGFGLIRMYDSGENTRATLRLIREHDLPIRVLLGIWLDAEFSNHDGCPWLHEPIPDETLAANTLKNEAEIRRGIELANGYRDIIVAVNVGNEALVEWNDHMVPLDNVIAYVREVKSAIAQPVTVADNYLWWARDGAPLAAEVDFLGVHTYPQWEGKSIDEAMPYTIANIEQVRASLPDKPIAILEAGWATIASEFGDRASEEYQLRYYEEIAQWAAKTNTTVFFFEAFDEPWKGDPGNPLGAEKHWGLWNVDRTPKQVVREGPLSVR